MNKQRGFTLIEIAIVLVIIGLLLGGVLKGQELITSARVRNLIAQQDGTKAAYFGFVDRFRALPGDYGAAIANINGVAATAFGNGNGQIEGAGTPPAGGAANEDVAVWDHLSKAGFITGSYTHTAGVYTAANAAVNPYTAFIVLRFDNVYADNGTPGSRHNLKTGVQVPADLLAEIDRKVDDGLPQSGSFRFTAGIAVVGLSAALANCVVPAAGAVPAQWKVTGTVEPNCAGTTLF